jgi:hypothetical protein
MLARLFVLALALTGCAGLDRETFARRSLLVASDAVILCDLSQTLWMANGGRWNVGLREANPMLGSFPSNGAIVAANLGAIALNTAAYYILPRRWGSFVNGGVLLVEGANVATQPNHNTSDGYTGGQHHGCDVQRQIL